MTQTLGRRVDAASVRGTRVAIAGAISAPDAFGGSTRFELTKVIDLADGRAFEYVNWGRVRSLRLTGAGTAVGLERRAGAVALFVLTRQGRVLLDRQPQIRALRIRGEQVGWTAVGHRRRYDATVRDVRLQVAGPVPREGISPLPGSFVAPRPGRYVVTGTPLPTRDRYDPCYGATSGYLRATGGGETVVFAMRPLSEGWCGGMLVLTLSVSYGADTADAPRRCRGRSVPCAGSLRLGRLEVPAA